MVYRLIDAVNKTLVYTRELDTHGQLTSLTDSPRQIEIDRAIQKWGQAVTHLYSLTALPMPNQAIDDQISLKVDTRLYPLPPGFIKLFWPLRNDENGYRIWPYNQTREDWGYQEMLAVQLQPDQYTGRPDRAALTPTRRELYLDRLPTATDAGLIYKFQYTRHFVLEAEDDTFPFPDACVDALVPVTGELMHGGDRDIGTLQPFFAQAARYMNPNPVRDKW